MTLERWRELMDAWSFPTNQATFDALRKAYSGKGRHYHSTEHVAACLRHLDDGSSRLESPREVEIAIWFHDAIYKPFASDNEEKSADWAASFLAEHGASREEVDRVHRLVRVTDHKTPTRTEDEAILVDIDLAILSADPPAYDLYEQDVRKEYRLVPGFLYRKKRAEILRSFLERPEIYPSGIFPEEAETQARQNLARAVAGLEDRA